MFSKAVRKVKDLIPFWKVLFNVINKDCLYLINKIFVMVVIIRDDTKRIVLYTIGCSVQYYLLQW